MLAAHGASAFVAPLASATVSALLRITAPLSMAAAPAPDFDALDSDAASDEPPAPVVFAAGTKSAQRSAKPLARAKPSALFVSEATVLKLAQSAARPRGSFVAQSPQHPAGLRLSGVAALGIGLQEGDIL